MKRTLRRTPDSSSGAKKASPPSGAKKAALHHVPIGLGASCTPVIMLKKDRSRQRARS